MDSRNAVYGRKTLPPSFTAGTPSIPTIDNAGFQVRFRVPSTGSSVVESMDPCQGNFSTSPSRAAITALASSTL